MNNSTVTYKPDYTIKKGLIHLLKSFVCELKSSKWLVYQLFRKKLLSTYKQSFFGIVWLFIGPLLNISIFILLNKSGVFNIGEISIPYPIYSFLGITIWNLFSKGIISGSSSLISARSMIIKINFPRITLVIADMGNQIISFTIQLIMFLILCLIYRNSPSIYIFLTPILIVPIVLLTLAVSFVLSILNAIVRDVGKILSALTSFFLYLTPILYAEPKIGILADITKFNPVFYLTVFPRDLILFSQISHIKGFIISSILCFIVFVIAVIIFKRSNSKVAERL